MAKSQRSIITIRGGAMEALETIRKMVEEEGGKNLLFRIPRLENTARYGWYLRRARVENGGGRKKDFIIALEQIEATLELEGSNRIEVYEKDKLLETLYSYRGVYQLPPVPIRKWFSRRIN